jgi:maleylacetate reductase
MAAEFAYTANPMRVVFGIGSVARVPAEVAALGLGSVLVVCSPGHAGVAEQVSQSLGDRSVGVLPEARMHVPVDVADHARSVAAERRADGVVAVGGGSAIGLGKAIALAHDVKVVAVPTTYAGSEMTPIWGLTEGGTKRTGRDPRVLPASVVYDPQLSVGLPVPLSVTSGMNAVAHAVEGLYAPDTSPIVVLMAEEGVRSLVRALPAIVERGDDIEARSTALCGAWLCGAVLGSTTMSLHHRLCHALGGTLDLPHAPTHTVVLPYVLAFNEPAAPAAVATLARALGGVQDPADELWAMAGRLGAPRSLAELGMARSDIERIADVVVADPYANPRPVSRDDVVRLLTAAWHGDRPRTQPSP